MSKYYKSYFEYHNDSPESIKADKEFIQGTLDTHAAYPADKNARILDVGCGSGRFMMTLRDLGFTNLIGIDVYEPALKKAQEIGLDARLEDAFEFLRTPPEEGEKFDAIYLLDLFEHIPVEKEVELMELLKKNLSDDGFIFIQTPNAMCPTASYFRYIAASHFTAFTPNSLAGIFSQAGFRWFDFRPHFRESKEVQDLKLPWARMYRQEYQIKDFILTPNIIAMLFNSEKAFKDWEENAPEMHNDYLESGQAPRKRNQIRRLWKHIREMRF